MEAMHMASTVKADYVGNPGLSKVDCVLSQRPVKLTQAEHTGRWRVEYKALTDLRHIVNFL